jgi:hypothetical protein
MPILKITAWHREMELRMLGDFLMESLGSRMSEEAAVLRETVAMNEPADWTC